MSDITPQDVSGSADKTHPFDAYEPPPLTAEIVPSSSSGPRFGRVKAICIAAIVLGGAGGVAALLSAVGLVVGKQLQAAFSGPAQPGLNPELQEAQQRVQQEIQAVQDRFWVPNFVLAGAHMVVATLLLTGGIQALRRVRPGRRLLVTACLSAIVFELVRGAVQTVIQVQVLSVTMQFFGQMIEASMEQAAEMAEWLAWFSRLAMLAGLLLAIGWVLAKLVFYSVAVWYLQKPVVGQYLDNP